jgi:hypothetical protein
VRVVSLVPSITETLAMWGIEPVAVTRFCERPDLLSVGGTKDPDIPAIVALAPDLVVMNEEENRAEDAEALEAAGLGLHVTRVRRVADVDAELEGLGRAVGHTGLPAPGFSFGRQRAGESEGTRAFVPIWRRPWMTLNCDTYGSSMLEALGIGNVYADAHDRYPTVTLEEAAARAPDVVLAPSEPYPFKARHVKELAEVAPVELVDGQDLFWWGARTASAFARLRVRLGAFTLLLVTALTVVACGDDESVTAGDNSRATSLRVEVVPTAGAPAQTATLICGRAQTATGFIVDAAATCELVSEDERARGRLVDGPAADRSCTQIYGGPQQAHVTGTLDGQRIDATVTRADGCGIADWTLLEPLLGAPV